MPGLSRTVEITHSHAFAVLEIEPTAFEDIKSRLEASGALAEHYDPADGTLILPGVALMAERESGGGDD